MKKSVFASVGVLILASIGSIAPAAAHANASIGPAPSSSVHGVGAAAATADWLTYHHDNSRAGVDSGEPPLSALNPGWTQSSLVGQIYASPLVYGSTVYVATEDNYIYALDASSGSVLWSVALSTPMTSSLLPCGNVSPHVGITSTPVIDTSTNRIYAVGEVSTVHYVLWGINLTTHAIEVNAVVDPSSSLDVVYAQGQRGALGLSQGVVYIPFGGRAGDCNSPMGQPYHGVVLGARANDGVVLYNFTTNGGEKGIWAAGGESIDASGNVYVATGNGYGGTPNDSETVFKLNPNLTVANRWVPGNQAALDSADADVGSIIPGLVGGGDILQSGKSGDSYLLNSTLGQVQGPTHVCAGLFGSASFGAIAYQAPYIYIPCEVGLFAVTQSGNTFSPAWSFSAVHATSPIIAGGAVLVLDGGGSTLYALNPTTGAQITSVRTGSLTHFASPATGNGMVFVPGINEIDAFSMGGCTSASMSPGVASPQAPGATVTFTASATTCTTPEFKFFLQPPGGSWTAQTSSFGANTWAWNTTGLTPGVYGVGVWARQTGSGASYEAYWIGTFTLSVVTCTAATISTATASPQAPGAMITFNATATRCPSAQFRFWMIPHGGVWTMQRDYGAASWTWNTTGLTPGTYELGVWARQPGSSNAYDAYGFTTFAIGTGNCISAGLSPNLTTPQAPGATVLFTATSNSCTSPLYQFWLLPPGGGWTVKQSYSAATTWSWNTSGMPLGTYQVGAWVRASASSASYDAFFIGTFQLDVSPCTSASISASPASPQAPGTTVTFTASSTNCTAPTYQFWRMPPPGSAWSVVQPYGATTTLSWNTTGVAPGPYRIGVWARQSGSSSSYDSYAILTFWVGT